LLILFKPVCNVLTGKLFDRQTNVRESRQNDADVVVDD